MVRTAVLLGAFATTRLALGQAPSQVPIRNVTAVAAVSGGFQYVDGVRELAGGKLLVNDGGSRELVLFDPSLKQRTVLADTLGTGSTYPRFGRLLPYLGDSSLFYISDSRSLQLIDPEGKFIRVLALPRPQDFNSFTNGGTVGTDARGRLVYQGRRGVRFPPQCRLPGEPPPPTPTAAALQLPVDSVGIIRADFETRTADTIGRAKVAQAGLSIPVTTTDAACKVTAAKVRMNPSLPATDSWVLTSQGSIAIVRGYDYHIDWIDADGTRRSTRKLPFDWRRLTDADKQVKIDSARRIVDSLTAIGGFRLKACGRGFSFMTAPPDSKDGEVTIMGGGGGGSALGGGGGGRGVASASAAGGEGPVRPPECQTVVVAAEFAPLDSMASYIAPIREESARADLDGNVWILPTTSASAKGGLLYDVVSPAGDLVERVQLPGGCDIIGFGRGGVLYLTRGDYKTGFALEKVKVVR